MMEVTNNFVAIVYERVDVDTLGVTLAADSVKELNEAVKKDRGQEVKWKEKYKIARFPTGLAE